MINSEIELINTFVFKACKIELSNIETELESQDYFAHNFKLNTQSVKYRKAKITPTKTGQFVTLWKRNKQGITEPFSVNDNFDLYLIVTRQNTSFGVFIFPKMALYENKILSDKNKDGKRGIRVYPTWNITTNKQAQKTQTWQANYFLNLTENIDLKRAIKLLNSQ